ncbi:MAG: threonine/serine exporter [Deltaproteobacteria bacterium]|nr:MAG: threonine/serine exporter [Deltaproteobacteria bacterium]
MTDDEAFSSDDFLDRQQLADVLDVVFRIGSLLAKAGAVAFRVRETMIRTAASLGVRTLEVVVTADSLHATARSGPHFRTRLQRLPAVGVNMNLIAQLELLSRHLFEEPHDGPLSEAVAAVNAELDALEGSQRLYPLWATGPLLGLSCAAFCGVMGGNGWQMGATFVGTYVGHLLRLQYAKKVPHRPVATVVVTCAFVSALFTFLAARLLSLGAPELDPTLGAELFEPAKPVLASVLYLIPGVPLIGAFVDLLNFDLNAGVARGAFALMVVTMIAIGVLAFWSIFGALA